jgi:hypothetical protein
MPIYKNVVRLAVVSLFSCLVSVGTFAEFKLTNKKSLICSTTSLKRLRGTLSPFLLDSTFTKSNDTLTSGSVLIGLLPGSKETNYRKYLLISITAKYTGEVSKTAQITIYPNQTADERIQVTKGDTNTKIIAKSKLFGDFVSLSVPNTVYTQKSVRHATLSMRRLASDNKISVVDLKCQILPATAG